MRQSCTAVTDEVVTDRSRWRHCSGVTLDAVDDELTLAGATRRRTVQLRRPSALAPDTTTSDVPLSRRRRDGIDGSWSTSSDHDDALTTRPVISITDATANSVTISSSFVVIAPRQTMTTVYSNDTCVGQYAQFYW